LRTVSVICYSGAFLLAHVPCNSDDAPSVSNGGYLRVLTACILYIVEMRFLQKILKFQPRPSFSRPRTMILYVYIVVLELIKCMKLEAVTLHFSFTRFTQHHFKLSLISIYRSGKNQTTRRRLQVQTFLADHFSGSPRGRISRFVPRSRYSTHSSNSKYCNHDVNLWGYSLLTFQVPSKFWSISAYQQQGPHQQRRQLLRSNIRRFWRCRFSALE